MKQRKQRVSPFEERKQQFLRDFSREAPAIRESILKDLPAYNMLLSLRAESFAEIQLRSIADQRGVPYNRESPPVPECPYCNSTASVSKKERDIYRCKACDRTFSVNYNSIISGTKCDALTYMKILRCMLDHTTISTTCDMCDISLTTYYKLRNRIIYAMSLLLEELRLYGHVEVDLTFVRSSFKGVDLRDCEFPEDSIFFDPTFKPRQAKHRGGAFSHIDKNANNLCIFTAIDDRGHVLATFTGVGVTNYRSLKVHVPFEKYLTAVPAADPFPWQKKAKSEAKTRNGDPTRIIADKEAAIKKYAENLGIDFESHVYRKNGVQLRLSEGASNIQRVNALHKRLKNFLREHGYVSSKYLPLMLTLFCFVENTGASQESINRLFQIMAAPGLGKPATFYQEMCSVPNYLEEWLESDNPLKKFPYKKLLAYYLYDQNKKAQGEYKLTMKGIEREVGYTIPVIRSNYRSLKNAGYGDLILEHFRKIEESGKPKSEQKKSVSNASATFNPTVLAIYDEYAENRKLPTQQRVSLEVFVEQMNKKYGTSYKRANLRMKFTEIENSGIRPPLPKMTRVDEEREANGCPLSQRWFDIYEDYNKIVLSYRQRGERVPPIREIHEKLQEKYNVAPSTMEKNLSTIRSYFRKQRMK